MKKNGTQELNGVGVNSDFDYTVRRYLLDSGVEQGEVDKFIRELGEIKENPIYKVGVPLSTIHNMLVSGNFPTLAQKVRLRGGAAGHLCRRDQCISE